MSQGNISEAPLLGGIEAGGTKFVCVVGCDPDTVLERYSFPTTDPGATLDQAIAFFRRTERKHGRLAALGVASFGPVILDPKSADYGRISQTPKPGWSNAPVVAHLAEALDVPIGFDTDVNGAALGERCGGAAAGLDHYVYVTVGTGIGAGLVSNGQLVNGMSHPEVGHMQVARHPDDEYPGHCRFHSDCLEGLACGPALKARWGKAPDALPESHPAWEMQAHYLACMCQNLTCCLAPQRIILGGGVMQRARLYQRTRRRLLELAGDYFPWICAETAGDYIVPPGHGEMSGVIGALVLAKRTLVAT